MQAGFCVTSCVTEHVIGIPWVSKNVTQTGLHFLHLVNQCQNGQSGVKGLNLKVLPNLGEPTPWTGVVVSKSGEPGDQNVKHPLSGWLCSSAPF